MPLTHSTDIMIIKKYGTGLLLPAAAFLILMPVQGLGIHFNALEVLFWAAAVVWLPCRIFKPFSVHTSCSGRMRHFLTFYLLFLGYLACNTMLFASDVYAFNNLFKWAEILSIAGVVLLFCGSVDKVRFFYWLLWMSHAALVLHAIAAAPWYESEWPPRIRIGMSSVMVAAMALPFVNSRRRLLLFLPAVLIVVFSQARAAWLGLTSVLFAYLPLHVHHRTRLSKQKIGIVFILIAGIIVFLPRTRHIFYQRLAHLGLFDEHPALSTYDRLYRLEYCLGAFIDHPIMGVGPNNILPYAEQSGRFNARQIHVEESPQVWSVHNVYAEMLAELGIIGFFMFTFVLYCFCRILRRLRTLSEYHSLLRCEIAGLVLYFVSFLMLLFFGYLAGPNRFLTGLFFGCVLSCTRLFNSSDSAKEPKVQKYAL